MEYKKIDQLDLKDIQIIIDYAMNKLIQIIQDTIEYIEQKFFDEREE